MKQVRKFILGFCSLAVLAGCQKSDQKSENNNLVLMPWVLAGDSSASLYYIGLDSVTDWKTLDGKYAEFLLSPQIDGSTITGNKPSVKFDIATSGRRISQDVLGIQLAAVYAHMQNMAKMDEEVGAKDINQWPRKIGVALKTADGSTNNAYYDGAIDAMLFIPYSGSDLSIAVNGGILAHEHFHSLFYKLVLKDFYVPLQAEDSPLATVIRGTNEGLADFWGWLYTDNPDFIMMSLPEQKNVRSLNSANFRGFESGESITGMLKLFKKFSGNKNQNYSIGYSYNIGNQLAKFLRMWTLAEYGLMTTHQDRIQVGARIVSALKSYSLRVKSQKDYSNISTQDFVEEFLDQNTVMTSKACHTAINALNLSSAVKYKCEGEENAPNTIAKSE